MLESSSEFKRKLKSLLGEYDASIGADVDDNSDWNAYFGEHIVIYAGEDEVAQIDGWFLSAKEL